MGAQFGGHQPSQVARQRKPRPGIRVVLVADPPQRRQRRESRPETLHPPALVVDTDHQGRTAYRMDVGDQARELRRIRIVARKENDAPHQRVRQYLAVLGLQLESLDIHHQRSERHVASGNCVRNPLQGLRARLKL